MALAEQTAGPATPLVDLTPYLDGFQERGDQNRKDRQVSKQSVAELKEAGFFLSLLPKQYGGLEMSPQEFFRLQMQIAEYDMSTAWIGGIIAVHAYQLALMDPKACEELYSEEPNTLVSSSYNPMGGKVTQAENPEEGLMLQGRWGWSSGSEHCTWALLGAIVPGEGYRTFLVPRSQYRIEDTWHAMGLEGTGSNDVVIDEPIFVPHHRTHKQMDGFNIIHSQKSPLYNIPWAQWFTRVVSTPAIGAAKHALKLFIDASGGSSTDPSKLMGDPDIQRRVAEVANMIDEAEAILFRNFDDMMDRVVAGQEIPMVDRARYRYQAGIVIDKMIKAIDLLMDVAGGRSVFVGHPIQNIWHDIHIARAHVANNPTPFARNWGGMQLGADNGDVFI